MSTEPFTVLAVESYRTHQARRTSLFAAAFVGLGLFAIAYATWPADQNKDLVEPVGLSMTIISLLLILADIQIAVQIERAKRAILEAKTGTTGGSARALPPAPVVSAQGAVFAVLAVMWSYLASIGAGGAPLWGMILAGPAAVVLLVFGAWRINTA